MLCAFYEQSQKSSNLSAMLMFSFIPSPRTLNTQLFSVIPKTFDVTVYDALSPPAGLAWSRECFQTTFTFSCGWNIFKNVCVDGNGRKLCFQKHLCMWAGLEAYRVFPGIWKSVDCVMEELWAGQKYIIITFSLHFSFLMFLHLCFGNAHFSQANQTLMNKTKSPAHSKMAFRS